MKKAIIIHGVNKSKEFASEHLLPVSTWHWLGWLQQQYNIAGVSCQNPLFPNSWFPEKNYEDDEEVFSNFKIDEDTRLICWSAGVAFILKYLYLHPEIKARHLVLLSPYLNPNNAIEGYFNDEFPADLADRFKTIDLLYSTDDPVPSVPESAEKLSKIYKNINVHKFENYGHFQEQVMGSKEFPELWDICKKEI